MHETHEILGLAKSKRLYTLHCACSCSGTGVDGEGRLAVSWERELHPGPVNCSQPKPVEASPFHISSTPVQVLQANGTKVCFYLHISIFPLAVIGIDTTYFFTHKWTFTRPEYFLQWRPQLNFNQPPQFHPSLTGATSSFDFSAQLIVVNMLFRNRSVYLIFFTYSSRYLPLY